MQTPARLQHPFWKVVPLELVASLVVGAVALLLPLKSLDDSFNAWLLQGVGRRQAPASVIVLTITEEALEGNRCSKLLDEALRAGNAAGALVVPPADRLCQIRSRFDGRQPIVVLAPDTLRRHAGGVIVGFRPRAVDRPAFHAIGIDHARWVAPRDWRSVPSIALTDLNVGRVPKDVVEHRLAVVAIDEPTERAESGAGPLAARLAGSVSAALEDRPRAVLARGWVALFAMLFGAALFFSRRWRSKRSFRTGARIVLGVVALGSVAAGALGVGYLLPLPSTLLGLGLGGVVNMLPSLLAARRADTTASEILSQAAAIGSPGAHRVSDLEFWAGLARRVAQAHPADGVLVAELPPFSWRLVVHPNGDLTEAVIRERRRDIRRTPYTDEDGRRTARVIYGFVAMKEVPTVLVPLESQGEPEGFIFLLGRSAEEAFVTRPDLTERLASDITRLIRGRRLGHVRANEWRRPGGVLVESANSRAETIIAGARDALDRLAVLNRVLTGAPVGLLYADSFGDVRMISEAFAQQLRRLGVQFPDSGPGGTVAAGELELRVVLDNVAERAGQAPPALDELRDRPFQLHLPVGDDPSQLETTLLFTIKRFEASDGPGFVASLVESAQPTSSAAENVERFPHRGDPLTVFSLTQVAKSVVDAAAKKTNGSVKLQTPRVMAHVVGHRQEITRSLADFLVEAASGLGARTAPILTVRERQHRVELTIMDLQLGAPGAAVKRTLLAPSQPPPGLSSLGALIRNVENSHGTVSLRNEEGWGLRLTLSFVRARPRVEPEPSAAVVSLPMAPKVPDKLR